MDYNPVTPTRPGLRDSACGGLGVDLSVRAWRDFPCARRGEFGKAIAQG